MKSSPHKQERALATRRDLMEAAREVFASAGFESARIEEIAARAGKTRGAFYANFSDKEDVFFAIFEEDLIRHQERIAAALSTASSFEEKIDILAGFLLEILQDRQRVLLNLEFKAYVIRHSRKRKRLQEIYSEMCLRCGSEKISALLPDADPATRRKFSTEVGVTMDGIALNVLFNPEGLSESQLRRLLQTAAREALQHSTEP